VTGALAAPVEQDSLAASTEQLRTVLSRALARRRPRARIIEVERTPSPYGSSWWLEEITIHLSDSSRVGLIFKDLAREAEGSATRRVKPAFVREPGREGWVYHNLLMDVPPAPPALWAAVTDVAAGRHWLFIERVNGTPLAQIGHRDAWCAAAEWLGRFHATAPVPRAARGPLLHHDREYHRRWLARALRATRKKAARDRLARLRALAPAHDRAIAQSLAARKGPSLIHGEFYASNVLIEQGSGATAVHPVDWEMTALGPPLLDLAALMSGRWGARDRIAMAAAYREGARFAGARSPGVDELLREVAACHLLLAIQWLGWAADWRAPADHRNDWLEEAELCAHEMYV
jgi:hypothetical protein